MKAYYALQATGATKSAKAGDAAAVAAAVAAPAFPPPALPGGGGGGGEGGGGVPALTAAALHAATVAAAAVAAQPVDEAVEKQKQFKAQVVKVRFTTLAAIVPCIVYADDIDAPYHRLADSPTCPAPPTYPPHCTIALLLVRAYSM